MEDIADYFFGQNEGVVLWKRHRDNIVLRALRSS